MKFQINNLTIKTGTKDGKPWTLYKFINAIDNQEYSAFSQAGYTDNFKPGYEFEAEVTTKPNPKGGYYRNVQWPKSKSFTPSDPQMQDAIKGHLERIERKLDVQGQKLDKVLAWNNAQVLSHTMTGAEVLEMERKSREEIPYEDSPPPTDEDAPF